MIKIQVFDIQNIEQQYFDKIKSKRFICESGYFFREHLEELILCKPSDLQKITLKYAHILPKGFKKYMLGQYERIICGKDGLGYWLTRRLGVNVCPYCNQQYIHTYKTRPQLDHFYPKSKYPYLALSFYNLIPCCSSCNSLKKEYEIGINPYVDDFGECEFEIDDPIECSLNRGGNWKLQFKNVEENTHKKNIEILDLEALYYNHRDYIEEMVFKARSYNDDYYGSLLKSFNNIELTVSEMRRVIFGNYVEKKDFSKRPLAKLTVDILKQLEVNSI